MTYKIRKMCIEVVLEQSTPKRVKDIQKFLELVNYYKRFVKDFTKITKLLYAIVEKNQK